MLDRDHVHFAAVEEAGRAAVGFEVLLVNLVADHVRILVARLDVINRHREATVLGMPRRHSPEQVRGEGGNAAFSRQVVAEKRDGSNTGLCFHYGTCLPLAQTSPIAASG